MSAETPAVSTTTAAPSPSPDIRPATIEAIRHLAPDAARVRVHVSPGAHHYAAAFNDNGVRLNLRLGDRVAIGRWVARAFADVDWAEPHTLDMTTGRVWHSANPGVPVASADSPADER